MVAGVQGFRRELSGLTLISPGARQGYAGADPDRLTPQAAALLRRDDNHRRP